MTLPADHADQKALDFLTVFLADREAGEVRSLASYLEEFSGCEDVVAREWLGGQDGSMWSAGGGSEPAVPSGEGGSTARRIGPYELLEELGRGGQAVVYLARDPRLGRKVALKVLSSRMGPAADELVARFRREAEVTARLDHPAICPIFDTGVHDGTAWIAMRHVEGETLARALAGARVDAPTRGEDTSGPTTRAELRLVLEVLEEAARALHSAHEAGVVHRDIKPANFMIGLDGRPVILDFGLAHEDSGDLPALTRTGEVFGTPAYMAPEQIAADHGAIDRRTDIWSLGVTLHECLTLQRPFAAPTREGLYRSILTEDPVPPSRVNPAVDPDLDVVVATALDKDPLRRYRTAADFAEDLRRVRELEPILARPAGSWTRFRRWTQRNTALAGALLMTFVVLVAGLVTSLFLLEDRNVALEEFGRLADGAKAKRLLERSDRLWPRRPELIPKMNEWLVDARAAAGRLAIHEKMLAELRDRALPYSAENRALDEARRLALHPRLHLHLEWLYAAGKKIDRQIKSASAFRRIALGVERRQLAKKIVECESDSRFHERHTWEFALPLDDYMHGAVTETVANLKRIGELIPQMEERREFARSVTRRTLVEAKVLWDRCLNDLAADVRFENANLRPQIGLIPLGRNEDSGFWEFWHVGSGDRPEWKGKPMAGRAKMRKGAGLVFVLLPAGPIMVGAQSQDPKLPHFDRNALHIERVREWDLPPFFISKYEVTQDQWLRLSGRNPSQTAFKDRVKIGVPSASGTRRSLRLGQPVPLSLHPVEMVNWFEADQLFRRFGLDLPGEWQWEYAARGGRETPWWTGEDRASLAKAENLSDQSSREAKPVPNREYEAWDDGYAGAAPVGRLRPNPFGLYDMLGNVREWCRDTGGRQTVYRMYRGGAFSAGAFDARVSRRASNAPEVRNPHCGARPVRALDAPLER
ncbi:MAG: hypothetical protein CMJ83_08540 [Planctomycetes bacterium]|nr:hypothetical protein [Planctomycetota bacterium]